MPPPDGEPGLKEKLEGLTAFLLAFEAPGFEFGHWEPSTMSGSQVKSLPYHVVTEQAGRFIDSAYRLSWVRPDVRWPALSKTPEALMLRKGRERMGELATSSRNNRQSPKTLVNHTSIQRLYPLKRTRIDRLPVPVRASTSGHPRV